MPIASITGSLTRWIGDAGLYAVFGLMFVDAVFPAASEVVMVYGGAVAAGAFAGQSVTIFGVTCRTALPHTWGSPSRERSAISSAPSPGGRSAPTAGGRCSRSAGGSSTSTPAGSTVPSGGSSAGATGLCCSAGVTPVVRSFISIPAGVFRAALGRYTALTLIGSAAWCFALAGVGWAVGSSWERFHRDFRYADYVVLLLVAVGIGWVAWKLITRRRGKAASGPGYTGSSE